MPNRRSLGAESEDRAAEFLLGIGYSIVTRRFTARRGEIDIVALNGDELVFVEVRSRMDGLIRPEDTLSKAKWGVLEDAAADYMAKAGFEGRDYRFEVIAIDRDGLRHYDASFTLLC